MKKLLIILLWTCSSAFGQSLSDSMLPARATGYIFINPAAMNNTQMIFLAQQARKTGAELVLKGFVNEGKNQIADTYKLYAYINEACCAQKGPVWKIEPSLYKTFGINAVPAFVVAQGTSGSPATYSKVAGMFGFDHALELFATSKNKSVKDASIRALHLLD